MTGENMSRKKKMTAERKQSIEQFMSAIRKGLDEATKALSADNLHDWLGWLQTAYDEMTDLVDFAEDINRRTP